MPGSEGRCRVGTSGYQYDHWVGVLYPEDASREEWFGRYAGEFDTVEINSTFYGLPGEDTFEDWRGRAPEGFLYALKFSRYGSHRKKLRDPQATVGRFLEQAERLGDRLGPVLVQLPPNWKPDPGRLDAFLEAAPGRIRWAVEFREPGWLTGEVFEILRGRGAALCIHDMIPDHPRVLTAGWTYLRYHGGDYTGEYTHQALTAQARWIRGRLSEGRDVYAFFNNDAAGRAVRCARNLRRYLSRE